MFPSSNYFRDIPCPFFTRVACPRPHCHFKHSQTTSQSTLNASTSSSVPTSSSPSSSSSLINIPADANETLNKLITQLSSAAGSNSLVTTGSGSTTPPINIASLLHNTLLQSLTTAFATALNSASQPTTNNNNETSDKVAQPTTVQPSLNATSTSSKPNTSDTVPEYRPTPIAELERRRRIQQQTISPNVKSDTPDLDNDDYVQATFSPPTNSSSPTSIDHVEHVEIANSKVSTNVSKPISPTPSQNTSKQLQPSLTDDSHSWVTPPVRRKLSSSSDYNDLDERRPLSTKRVALTETSQSPMKVMKKPTATVKPSIIENINKSAAPTNPMLKRIPKKTTPAKTSFVDIDLDQVPVTPSISIDDDNDLEIKSTPKSLKRPSDGISSIPQKKSKLVPTKKPIMSTNLSQNVKKNSPITNGAAKTKLSDEDEELAQFDVAFNSSKPAEKVVSTKRSISATLTPMQQLALRYSSMPTTSTDSLNSNVIASHTRAETSNDGRRIAHQPKVHPSPTNSAPSIFQPLIDRNTSLSKLPLKTRQEYLDFFVNQLKNHTSNANNAAATTAIQSRAQTIEKEIYDKSTNRNSYLNLAAKYSRQLKSEAADNNSKTEKSLPTKPNPYRFAVSHSAMLSGGKTENISFAIKKPKEVDIKALTDNELYTLLLAYRASDQDLTENGYPAFSLDFPDKVLIKNRNPVYNPTTKVHSTDPNTRLCCRCSKMYKVDKDRQYVKQEECIYHWGRLRPQKIAGQIEKTYSCCSAKINGVGCAVSQYHVHDGNDVQLLSGYVKTQALRKPLGPNESYGIYALDCEMCYTIDGLELVRISVINHKLECIYETLVKPLNKVLDYNTRWSGITEQHLQSCSVRLDDVQKRLLKLFNDKSILIGHSLESDLKALKIVHDTVIDTSLVFPHAKGKPFKRALKTLMSEFLTKIIQENTGGHDSKEDAVSCMELILWKVKQDLKSTTSKS